MNIFGSHFLDKYEYKYIWVYQKWANMKTNMIIWTDICEYKYKYKYNYTQNQKNIIDMFMDMKAIKVCKLVDICAII